MKFPLTRKSTRVFRDLKRTFVTDLSKPNQIRRHKSLINRHIKSGYTIESVTVNLYTKVTKLRCIVEDTRSAYEKDLNVF